MSRRQRIARASRDGEAADPGRHLALIAVTSAQSATRPGFVVRNPAFREDIARSFDRQGALRTIGATLDLIEPGLCHVRVPIGSLVTCTSTSLPTG